MVHIKGHFDNFTTTQRQSRFESEVRLKTGGRPKRWAVRLNQQLLPWFFDKVGAAKGQSIVSFSVESLFS